MRAAIYARVSSAAQRDSQTIESQLHVLPAFVVAQGWSLVGTYTDDGRSAKTGQLERRDGFARLMADAEARRFDVLVVLDVNRLTRTGSIEERAEILGPFQRLGIQIATPSTGIQDLRSFLGEFWVTVQALVAAEENRKRATAIKSGKVRAIAEGRKPAGPTPYGLSYCRELAKTDPSRGWSINPVTSEIVREIFRRVIAGDACQTIADDLHARGVPPVRSASSWQRDKVYRIVRARYTVGEWSADKAARAIIPVPAIIDEATYQAAQEKLKKHNKRGLRKTRYVYLLEGLAKCGMCGAPMCIRSPIPETRRRNGTRSAGGPAAYVCRNRKYENRGERCTSMINKVPDVDARVWAKVERALRSDDLANKIAAKFDAQDANRRDWQADVKSYESKLAALAKTEASVLARYHAGKISDAAFDLDLDARRKQRAALQTQLEAARAASVDTAPQVSAADFVAALRALAEETSQEARRQIVLALVEPGAVFDGEDVHMKLAIDPAPESRASVVLATAPDSRRRNETIVKLRVVA